MDNSFLPENYLLSTRMSEKLYFEFRSRHAPFRLPLSYPSGRYLPEPAL